MVLYSWLQVPRPMMTNDWSSPNTNMFYCRLVGGLITLNNQYSFVVENNEGMCGYVVAAPDANEFHTRMTVSWLPEMQQKYPAPVETESTSLTLAQVIYYWLLTIVQIFEVGRAFYRHTTPVVACKTSHPPVRRVTRLRDELSWVWWDYNMNTSCRSWWHSFIIINLKDLSLYSHSILL